MTDDELKELVASLAIAQRETEAQMKRSREELDKRFQETERRFQETEDQMRRSREELDKRFQETEDQIRRNDEKLTRMGISLGNIGQNQGDVSEEFFFNSLVKDPRLGQIHFDEVAQNMKKHRGQLQEEYDVVLTNGDAVGIVEVKYKAHKNDLDKLERKMRNFKILYPWFEGYKIYGALAAFNVNEVAKREALQRGYFVLQQCGDLMHTESGEQLLVL